MTAAPVIGDQSRRVTVELPENHRALVDACLRAFALQEPVTLYVNGQVVATPNNHGSIRDDDVIVVVDAKGRSVDLSTYARDFAWTEARPTPAWRPPATSLATALGKFAGVSEYEERYKQWPIERSGPVPPPPSKVLWDSSAATPRTCHQEFFVRHPVLAFERVEPPQQEGVFSPPPPEEATEPMRTSHQDAFVTHPVAFARPRTASDVRTFSHREVFTPDESRQLETTSNTDYTYPPRGSLAAFVARRTQPPKDNDIGGSKTKFTGKTEVQDAFVAHPRVPRAPAIVRRAEPPEAARPFDAESEYASHYRQWPLDQCQRFPPPPPSFEQRSNVPFTAQTTTQVDFSAPPPASLTSLVKLAQATKRSDDPENRTFETTKHDFKAPPRDFVSRASTPHRAVVHLEPELTASC